MGELYYDPESAGCYLPRDLQGLDNEIRKRLVSIETETWLKLVEEANNTQKRIVTGDDGLPVLQERTKTAKEIAEENIRRCYTFFKDTSWIHEKKNVMEDAEWREKYASIISQQAEARAKINEIEEAYPELKSSEPTLTLIE